MVNQSRVLWVTNRKAKRMELLCVECVRTLYRLPQQGKEPNEAVTLIEGTAYCRSHAESLLKVWPSPIITLKK